MVSNLRDILGKKLTAYIASVSDIRALDRWIEGRRPNKDAEARMRWAYTVAAMLHEVDDAKVVQAWFIGINPELGDRTPIHLLAKGAADDVKRVVSAARTFRASG